MWSNISPFPNQYNKSSYILKSSFSDIIKDNISKNTFNEIDFKTPVKEINKTILNNNLTPFKLDFNYCLENVNSTGPFSINQINSPFILFNKSPNQSQIFQDKEKDYLFRKSTQISSFQISPKSMKENTKYFLFNNNSDDRILSENKKKINDDNIFIDEISKKNLSFIFNKIKCDNSLYNNDNILNNSLQIEENKENIPNNKKKSKFIFSLNTPNKNNSQKKLFECSGSTITTISSIFNHKRKRLRKNNEQLFLLKKFYSEHKYWNKKQIREISCKVGIKENKVYKWLWDQRNKETRNTKFIINKKLDNNVD